VRVSEVCLSQTKRFGEQTESGLRVDPLQPSYEPNFDLSNVVQAHIETPRTTAGRVERGLGLRLQLARRADPASRELLQELDRDALSDRLLQRSITERRRALPAPSTSSPLYGGACLALARALAALLAHARGAQLARLTKQEGIQIGHISVVFAEDDGTGELQDTIAPEVASLLASAVRARAALAAPAARVYDALPRSAQGEGALADLVCLGRAVLAAPCTPAEEATRTESLGAIAARISRDAAETRDARWATDGIELWRGALARGFTPQDEGAHACSGLLRLRSAGLGADDGALKAETITVRRELLARVEADPDADEDKLGAQRGHLSLALLHADPLGTRTEAETLLRDTLQLIPRQEALWARFANVQLALLREEGADREARALQREVAFTKTILFRVGVRLGSVIKFFRMLVWLMRRPSR
jgi:hypothetical protein